MGKNVHVCACVYSDLIFPLDTPTPTVFMDGLKYLNTFHPHLLSSIHEHMWGVHPDRRVL